MSAPNLPAAARGALRALVLATMVAACGGGGGSAGGPAAPVAQTITLSKSGNGELLPGAAAVSLTATPDVAGTVSWSVDAGPGTLSAASGATVSYTPPAVAVGAPTSVVITAKAGNASQSTTLTLYPDPGAPGLSLVAGDAYTEYDTWNPWTIAEQDGQGAAATFGRPALISADAGGNLYVIDYAVLAIEPHSAGGPGHLVLRKVSPAGAVTTLVHDSSEIAAPNSMAIDKAGNLYVASRPLYDNRNRYNIGGDIRKVTPAGSVSVFAGSSGSSDYNVSRDGTGAAAAFTGPSLAGIDGDGNLYVQDVDESAAGKVTLRKITPQAVVTTISSLPAGLDRAPDGYAYATDSEQATVFRVAADNTRSVLAGVAGRQGTVLGPLPGGLLHPRAVVRTGPASVAVISGSGIVKVVLPH
jgi:sugar lactone lactonase YvrE